MTNENVQDQFWKGLSSEVEPWGWLSFEVDDWIVHLLLRRGHLIARQLEEGRQKGDVSLGGRYSARLDPPHASGGQKHIHVYAGNNQLFALNIDGTAHDQSHGTQIYRKVARAITQRFPGFRLPSNNFIESIDVQKGELKSLFEIY